MLTCKLTNITLIQLNPFFLCHIWVYWQWKCSANNQTYDKKYCEFTAKCTLLHQVRNSKAFIRSFLFRVGEGFTKWWVKCNALHLWQFSNLFVLPAVDSATTHHFRRSWMKWTIMQANESLSLKTWWPASVWNLPNTFRIWNRSAKQWERGAGRESEAWQLPEWCCPTCHLKTLSFPSTCLMPRRSSRI